MNINYLVIETNKVKLGGYFSIKYSLLEKLVESLYVDKEQGYNRLSARYRKYMSESNKQGLPTDRVEVPIRYFTKDIRHNQKYLLTSEDKVIKDIYIKAQTNPAYYEFAFVLFLIGAVNSYDYLRYFRDIGDIVGRFTVEKGYRIAKLQRKDSAVFQPLIISTTDYAMLMSMYLYNTSIGIDYGFRAYDFVYHMLGVLSKGDGSYNKYSRVISIVKSLGISSSKAFSFSTSDFSKYREEIGVMIPVLSRFFKRDKRKGIIESILIGCNPMLIEAVLSDGDFLKIVELESVECNR